MLNTCDKVTDDACVAARRPLHWSTEGKRDCVQEICYSRQVNGGRRVVGPITRRNSRRFHDLILVTSSVALNYKV